MISPVSHANPTEIVTTATSTSHVITTLVLFDVLLTSWTLLRVGSEPFHVVTLCIILRVPLFSGLAVTRHVINHTTREAGDCLAEIALNIVKHLRLVQALTRDTAL